MNRRDVYSISGHRVDEMDLAGVASGKLGEDDFRISAETLTAQAEEAEAGGYPELAMNLRRAAEITAIPHKEVLEIYARLRPGRSSHAKLISLADHLETAYRAPLTAELVREAAGVYLDRGLIQAE